MGLAIAERLAALEPENTTFLRDLSELRLNVGLCCDRLDSPEAPQWFEKALEVRRRLVQRASSDADLWNGLARACHERGAWALRHSTAAEAAPYGAECLAALNRTFELSPTSQSAWYLKARALAMQGDPDTAVAALARAVELGYDDVDETLDEQDLESLRGRRQFQQLIAEMRHRRDAASRTAT